MATGEVRSALSMSEPDLGSDVAAIRTAARHDGDDYVISGQKMWLTNGATSSLVALLARTEGDDGQPHRNLTAFLIEKYARHNGHDDLVRERVDGRTSE